MPSRRGFGSSVLATLAALPLGSCERGFRVELAGRPNDPDILLSPFGSGLLAGDQPSIDFLSVWPYVDGRQSRPIWAIDRDPSCRPTPRFHYGTIPPGWTASIAAEPLVPGRTYVLSMSGCGFIGGAAFKNLNSKLVWQEGSGDAPTRAVDAMR